MGWLIFSIFVFVVLFIVLGISKGNRATNQAAGWKLRPRMAFALLAFVLVVPGFFAFIPANTVGIVYSPFSGTREITLSEGVSNKNLFDQIYQINTEVQTMTVSNLTTQTKDAQYVTSTLNIKYKVNSANAYLVFTQYRTLDNMSNTLIVPTTQRVLELITTKYNVMDVLGEKRADIYSELDTALTSELSKYGVEFVSISISDMDAGDAIEAAIEAEAVAKKAVETAEQELLKAEMEAKQKSVVAQAEQDAAKIKAETKLIEARAEKEANELLQMSLTELILRQQWIEKWDGKVPTYYGGDGTDLIFDAGSTNP
jgi:regulator of protease activity HflC (stomatin/prohibitin superfamily)